MKNLRVLLTAIICFLYLNSFSQSVEMDWGQYKKLPDNSYFQKIIGTDNDGFFTIRTAFDESTNENKFFLEYTSSTTNTMETSNELIFPTINGILSEYEQIYYLNGKIILFSSITNQTLQNRTLYVQYLNNDGTLKNKPKNLGSIPLGNSKADGFKIILSDNNSKILVYFNNSFVEYNNEPFNFTILDANLTELFSGELTLPLKDKKFTIEQVETGKADNFYLLAKVLSANTKKTKTTGTNKGTENKVTDDKSKESFEYILYVYNTKKNELTPFNITVDKYVIKNIIFGLNTDEEIVIEGFISNKNSKIPNEFIGAFYRKINTKTLKPIEIDAKKSIMLFPKEFTAKFTQERNGAPEHFYDFKINKLGFFDNGTIVMLAEQQFVTTRTMVDPGTKEESYIYYYNYNDIICIGINKDGKLDWAIRIPKIQQGTDDYGYYSSYALIVDANKAKIMFNDNPANEGVKDPTKMKEFATNLKTIPKATAFMVTVYPDGSFEKDAMFPKEDAKIFLCPKLIAKSKQRNIVYGQKSNEYKFGTFAFD